MSVTLNITADSAAELQIQLAQLLFAGVKAVPAVESKVAPVTASVDQSELEIIQPEIEQPKPRRKRRTKAQIAADADKTIAAAPELDVKDGEEPPVTCQDVDVAMRELLGAGPAGGEAMVLLLGELGAKDDVGDIKISALAEDRYVEAIQKANEKTAEIKKGAGDAAEVLE